ncbi:hypothetical protein HHK36_028380 [Tetracentron sinense]|uniref:Pectin acetylesterase n=1 Tax=Tetracentron sinense TaxID=13715 RepID=A0A835D0J1_TETSI|nr:hypothetical protein HHK36_028380 [Tetracentron sinense]
MIRMVDKRLRGWLNLLVSVLIILKADGFYTGITYVQNAVAKGAVCLDGSPPAYHIDKGFGLGVNSWLVHIEGGGWCNNVTSCLARKNTRLGSSKKMLKLLAFSGILNNKAIFNPDFYNWNRVKVGYCDGGSFTGDVESVNPTTNLHFRGARVWLAVMEDLLAKGMRNAENALLSGCSAGGLTSILHCDSFRALLPMGTKGSAKNLPPSCTSKLKPSMIKNILAPEVADPHGYWYYCKLDIKHCLPSQIKTMQGFRSEFLRAVIGMGSSPARGMFINSCYAHCQSETQETWLWNDSPRLNKTPIAKAVGDWFYDRIPFQKIDCPYPCDSSCRNRIFDPEELPEE